VTRRFSRRVLALLNESKILRIRAGTDHRFLGIWVVVVRGRVFVRPWFDNSDGWRRAFLEEPRGAILVGGTKREIPVRARPVRGERVFDAIDAAYAGKYVTKASQKWVRGFATRRRRKTTLELLPMVSTTMMRMPTLSKGARRRFS
jgi:hypothetical protein